MSFAVPPCSLTSSHPHGCRQRSCHCSAAPNFCKLLGALCNIFPLMEKTPISCTSSVWDTCELWGHFRGVWIPWGSLFPARWAQHLQLCSEECPLPTSHSRLSFFLLHVNFQDVKGFFLLHVNFQDVKESLHLHRSKWEMYVKWGTTENYIF